MKPAETANNRARIYSAPLSRREVSLLAEWERERRAILTMDVIRQAVGADAAQDVAWRLVQKRALARVGRGKFLVRPLRTLNRATVPSAAVLAAALLQGERYYLGGRWALTFHRLTEQQYSSALDAFVTRRHQGRRLGAARLAFHRVQAARLDYGIATVTFEGVPVQLSDPERTLLDLLDYPSVAGTSDDALRLVESVLPKVSARKLVEYAARGSRSSTCQRLGVLLERAGVSRRAVAALHERVRSTKSVLSMRPGVSRAGRLNPSWRVVENDA
ncbi:MAG TPA: type IV toxin-antitoxin system AbiEi family antitoxin [Anaeromyxobacteraceae bacterium]|jgi:predicted transcriptional regulator of viral defense system|nr:type IV toxin-antitoxin system AbiEi family antitoxin [Anaeromyxobacteraceae bacterium]